MGRGPEHVAEFHGEHVRTMRIHAAGDARVAAGVRPEKSSARGGIAESHLASVNAQEKTAAVQCDWRKQSLRFLAGTASDPVQVRA